jgi:hypothetical protein
MGRGVAGLALLVLLSITMPAGTALAQPTASPGVAMHQDTIDRYARYIQHAADGHGVDRPVSVADIVEDIDWSQRDGVDLDELNAGLGQLIAQGLLSELPGFLYYEPGAPPSDRPFTPVTAEHFDQVMAERDAYWEPLLNAPDPATADPSEPAWPKLRVVSTFTAEMVEDGFEVDVESVGRAGGLIDLLATALEDAGIPARPGPIADPRVGADGVRTDAFVRILYGPRDADPARMLEIVRPVFEREAQGGSQLSVEPAG